MTPSDAGEIAVGFIGLGQMGQPMAMHLADWPGGLSVYDVAPDQVAALVEAGATAADSPAGVAAAADVICVMVRDDDQVRDVLAQILEVARPGTVVVIHSTIAPETAPALADAAGDKGVHVVDAPVSGGAMGAHAGTLAIMVGGSDEAIERCRGPLERMGDLVVHAGEVGSGTRMKLARNLMHFTAFTAATEAQRLAEAAGIDLVALGNVVRHSDAVTGGPGAIMHRATAAPLATDDPWYSIFANARGLGEKDLRLAIAMADELGVDTPLAELALQRFGPGLGLPEHTPTDTREEA